MILQVIHSVEKPTFKNTDTSPLPSHTQVFSPRFLLFRTLFFLRRLMIKLYSSYKTCFFLFLFIYLFIYFWPHHMARGIFPNEGSNPRSLQWKRGVLTTGPPGKSYFYFFKT